jgi:hypothetical protein
MIQKSFNKMHFTGVPPILNSRWRVVHFLVYLHDRVIVQIKTVIKYLQFPLFQIQRKSQNVHKFRLCSIKHVRVSSLRCT